MTLYTAQRTKTDIMSASHDAGTEHPAYVKAGMGAGGACLRIAKAFTSMALLPIMPVMRESAVVTIRPMTRPDLDGVLAIEQASFPIPWKREHFLQEIHSHISFPFVAVCEETVIGYVCMTSLFEEAQIMDIAVAPEHRGRGVGRMLMEQAIVIAREKGAERLVLEVRESNVAAIALYERFGFVHYWVRKGYYEGKENALLMEKALE
jgi:[ribosomal protein S18]-alanine N-acetyltransferase